MPVSRNMLRPAVMLAVAALLFFTKLGLAHVWDEDEAIFAEISREMYELGDWIVPRFNGKVFVDKPVMMYWLMMAGYKVFGTTEFGARCASALVGLATVWVTYLIGRRLFNERAGFWAGLILSSGVYFNVISRAATPDIELVFCCTLAMYAFVRGMAWNGASDGLEGPRSGDRSYTGDASEFLRIQLRTFPGWLGFVGIYAAIALGVLVKGPVAILLPGCVMGLYLLLETGRAVGNPSAEPKSFWRRTWTWCLSVARRLTPGRVLWTAWKMRPLTAIGVVLAIAGPWYLLVALQTDWVWPAGFFGIHNVGRFMHPMENHRGPIVYYLPITFIGFFPWSIFLIPSGLQLWRRAREGNWNPALTFLMCWILVWIGFFSVASTKLPNYVMPAYPALALVCAFALDNWLRDPAALGRAWLRAGWISLAVVGLGLVVALPLVAQFYFGGDPWLGLLGASLILGAGMLWRLAETGRREAALIGMGAMSVVFVMTLFAFVALRIDRHQNSQYFANVIRQYAGPEARYVGSFGYYRPSLVFYTQQTLDRLVRDEQVSEYFDTHNHNAFVFTTDEKYAQIAARLPADVRVLARSRWFLRKSEILLLGRDDAAAQLQAQMEPEEIGARR